MAMVIFHSFQVSNSSHGRGGGGVADPNCCGARGRVHPRQVASLSRDQHIQTEKLMLESHYK